MEKTTKQLESLERRDGQIKKKKKKVENSKKGAKCDNSMKILSLSARGTGKKIVKFGR